MRSEKNLSTPAASACSRSAARDIRPATQIDTEVEEAQRNFEVTEPPFLPLPPENASLLLPPLPSNPQLCWKTKTREGQNFRLKFVKSSLRLVGFLSWFVDLSLCAFARVLVPARNDGPIHQPTDTEERTQCAGRALMPKLAEQPAAGVSSPRDCLPSRHGHF